VGGGTTRTHPTTQLVITMSTVTTPDQLDRLYRPPRRPVLVEVPELTFLTIDGEGDPNTTPRYQAAIGALFGVSYTMKFTSKHAGGPDWKVGPLEGLWWTADDAPFPTGDRARWHWTAMIRQPDTVDPDLLAAAQDKVRTTKNLPEALELRLIRFAEGSCAQVMHVGPFSAEGPTIAALHAFIAEQGRTPRGRHHEIYLSDIRRVAEDRWKTVVRLPVGRP